MLLVLKNTVFPENLPMVSPLAGLGDPTALALYALTDNQDASANNKDLVTSATFNATGMNCTTTGSSANTGVADATELTIIVAHNFGAVPGGSTYNVLSNYSTAAAPTYGVRLTIWDDESARWSVGSGEPSGTTSSVVNVGTATGGWTIYGVRVKQGEISSMRKSGAVTTATFTHNRALSAEALRLNGAPPLSNVQQGNTGTLGLCCIYNSYFSDAKLLQFIQAGQAHMATKGIVV